MWATGEVAPDRVNSCSGYRRRDWEIRVGTIELTIPKLRSGSHFRSFLEHRRAERALASVVATSYLLGASTRRVEKLTASLGVVGLSMSQVSVMVDELDKSWTASGTGP